MEQYLGQKTLLVLIGIPELRAWIFARIQNKLVDDAGEEALRCLAD
jgi:hypothetical protein